MSAYDDVQALWQNAADPPPALGPEQHTDLLRQATRFDRKIRWRDRREYAGVAGVAVVAIWIGTDATPLVQVGAVLMVVGALVAVARLWRAQRRVPPAPPDLPAVAALRQSLARVEVQIELLRSVLWWYLTPLAVGPFVIVVGRAVEAFRDLPPDAALLSSALILGRAALGLGVIGGVYYWIYLLNQKAVDRKLEPLRDRFVTLLSDLPDD